MLKTATHDKGKRTVVAESNIVITVPADTPVAEINRLHALFPDSNFIAPVASTAKPPTLDDVIVQSAMAAKSLPGKLAEAWTAAGGFEFLAYIAIALVVAYGVLHHVPAHAKRKELLEVMGQRLSPGGILVATFWRFGAPELATRYRHRLLSFAADKTSPAFIDPEQLEAGDCLLQWGDDPSAFRYCHYCDDAEIDALVGDLRLARVDSFVADGRSSDLNRYEILRRER